MRDHVTTALEIVGAVSVAVGCFLVAIPVGLIVAGCLAVGAGYLFAEEDE